MYSLMRSVLATLLLAALLPLARAAAQEAAPAPDAAAQPLSEFQGRKVALVVGINQYDSRAAQKGFAPLNFAVSDAVGVAELLEKRMGFRREDIFLYADQSSVQTNPERVPTNTNLQIGVDAFLNTLNADTMAVIYYSGHGVREDGEDYWVPSDGSLKSLRISVTKIMADIAALARQGRRPRRLLVFFDACRPGSGAGEKAARPVGIVAPKRPADAAQTAVLYGCKEGQYSREYAVPPPQHGIFTRYLLQGLQGERAAADLGAGMVTFATLRTYVQSKVRQEVEGFSAVQEPDGWAEPETMSLVRVPRPTPEDLARMLDRAQAAVDSADSKKLQEAVEQVNLVLSTRHAAAMGRAYFILGQFYQATKQLDRARKAYGDAFANKYTDPALLAKMAELNRLEGRLPWLLPRTASLLASVRLASFQASDPARSRVLAAEAARQFQAGQWDQAAATARAAVDADGGAADAWLVLGRVAFSLRRHEEAVAAFTRVQELDGNPRRVQKLLEGAAAARRRDAADRAVREAALFLLDNRVPEAEQALQAGMALNPESPEAFEVLGSLRSKQGRDEEAAAAYQQALSRSPLSTSAADRLRTIRQKQRDVEVARLQAEVSTLTGGAVTDAVAARASGLLDRAESLDPENGATWLLRGALALKGRDFRGAARAYLEALALQPELETARGGLREAARGIPLAPAGTLLEQGAGLLATDPAGAEVRALEVLARDPASAPGWLLLGESRLRQAEAGRAQPAAASTLARRAARSFERALALQPGLPAGADGRTRAARQIGRLEAARLVDEAYQLLTTDRFLEAAVLGRDALEQDPASADAAGILAHAAIFTSGAAAAAPLVARAVEAERAAGTPSSFVRLAEGTHLYQTERFRPAEAELKRALDLFPAGHRSLALNNLGAAFARQKKWDRAEEFWQAAVEETPSYAYPHANLGTARFNQRKWKEARAAFEAAVRLNDRNGSFRAWLAATLVELDQKDEASAAAREAQRLGVLEHPVYKRLKLRS